MVPPANPPTLRLHTCSRVLELASSWSPPWHSLLQTAVTPASHTLSLDLLLSHTHILNVLKNQDPHDTPWGSPVSPTTITSLSPLITSFLRGFSRTSLCPHLHHRAPPSPVPSAPALGAGSHLRALALAVPSVWSSPGQVTPRLTPPVSAQTSARPSLATLSHPPHPCMPSTLACFLLL